MNKKILALSLASLLLGGCAGVATSPVGGTSTGMPSVDLLGQTQLPPGTKILYEQSLIMGSGDNWMGRVMLDVGKDAAIAYRFFLEQYPKQGWTLLSSVRGQTSMLVFTKESRNATIQINDASVVNSGKAILTVTPRVMAPKP